MIERYNLEGNIDPNGPLVFYEDYESLAARLADYEDAHRVTVEDCGAPDEQHCSCVPSLRLEMKRLQSRLAEEEHDHENTLKQRDDAEAMADKLAAAVATLLGVEIGEHSSGNCPWTAALEAFEERPTDSASAAQESER